tara:strand:+ start:20 stop:274 length:255 start_codon:yes stop_codon:yes gene_type:complete
VSKIKKVEKFLEDFLKKKEGKINIKNLLNKNLVRNGILDSMDIIVLTSNINKKFNIQINLASQTTLKKFEKFRDLVDLISKKMK